MLSDLKRAGIKSVGFPHSNGSTTRIDLSSMQSRRAPDPQVEVADPQVFRDPALEAVLAARGVTWPLGGFAPGLYVQTCDTCGERHHADKRALRCLPCAVVSALQDTEKSRGSAFDFGKRAGRAGLLDQIRKLAEGEAA